ncbi:MAG: ABC-type polysaccharide/polyol phosphate transport system, ATPase component [Candidatus Nitrotoga sp. SPKER]|nr:MAG: ABC-type polysaccharide/polyol phosphate transport system, ATPase component [Candidatus Nitrotoga sp. SPKER]
MPIIEVNHVTKEYQLGQLQSLKTTALNQWRRVTGQPVEERAPFKALNDVTFSVEQGEVLGIIGHNGAGKSTMLKLLANISKPSSGSIQVKGKIAPLIEVGAGLVGDLTGRENIYLNGAILGIPKAEIKRKFDDIVAFAELEEFIDTPIKRYSSGMQVRLGFSIATSVESDILIVDEVLAVGDLAFQRKCFDRMEDLIKRQGKTVLLVSHNIRQVERLCNRVILLNKGQTVSDGGANTVCTQFYEASDSQISIGDSTNLNSANSNEWATGEILLHSIEILDSENNPINKLKHEQAVKIQLNYEVTKEIRMPIFGIGIHTTDFIYLATKHSINQLKLEHLEAGHHVLTFDIPSFPFMPGVYSLRAGVAEGTAARTIFYAENLLHLQVVSDNTEDRAWSEGLVSLPGVWRYSTPSSNLKEKTHDNLEKISL